MDGEISCDSQLRGDIAPDVSPLRIAFLSYRSPPNVGGQGVFVDYVSRALVDVGHTVDVISGPPYPKLDPRVALVKLPSLDLYEQPHNGNLALRPRHLLSWTDTYEYFSHLSGAFAEPVTFGWRAFNHLKKHHNKYDVVLDNQTLASGILKARDRFNLPLVSVIHHPITHDLKHALDAADSWQARWLVRRWYSFHRSQIKVARKLKFITCPSHSAARDITVEFGVSPDAINPIPLGVDRRAFRPIADVTRAPNRLISTASADTPLKGLPILIEAYHGLLPSHPNLELVVIGKLRDGATRQMIEKLGLSDRITFKSGLTREDLAREFNAATIAVTPSLYEGFGLPAAEAMSCGTPVIVTDGGALPEVAGDAGIVVPRGNSAALGAAIANLIDNPQQREKVAAACLKRAEAVFDWAAIAPVYDALFRKAIAAAC